MLTSIPWAKDLAAIANEFGNGIAVSDGVNEISFRELAGRAGRVAHMLLERVSLAANRHKLCANRTTLGHQLVVRASHIRRRTKSATEDVASAQ